MKALSQFFLVVGIFVLVLVSVYAEETSDETTDISESSTGFSAQSGFDWLEEQIGSDGSVDQDVESTSLAILALDSGGYDTSVSQAWLTAQLSSDFCFPLSSCTVLGTSFAVQALHEVQDDSAFDEIAMWYQDALSAADVSGDWYLEVVTSENGTCVVSYDLEGTLQEIEIAVDQGVFTDCGNSHFLDLDACLQAGLLSAHPGIALDVDCGDFEGSVVLTHLYMSSSTYYLLANENAAQADFQVNNGCFGQSAGGSCDVLSTLYAYWTLQYLNSPLSSLVYLKENYDSSDALRVALMALVTQDTVYLEDLIDLQKSDGSFERDAYTTAFALLALEGHSEYATIVEDGKSYLREEQSEEGDWGDSVETTALVLYAAFREDDVSPSVSSGSEDVEFVSECDTNADCELLYGDGYQCDVGECGLSSGFGCATDPDCDKGYACLDDACVLSDCDYGQYCTAGKTCCDYDAGYNENVYNCPSDCSCGDGVCDDLESDTSSGGEYFCSVDCGGAIEDESGGDDDVPSILPPSEDKEEGSSLFLILMIVLFVVLLGVGGYFAYKWGLFDRFRRKGGKGSQLGFGQAPASYTPFTGRLPAQHGPPRSPFGNPSQPKRPF